MELSRQEYPALVNALSPAQAASILQERVKLITKINDDIADWLSERRRVEEAYVLGLRKLAARGPREVSAQLGVFKTPWQTILSSIESLAQSHHILATRIESDVEKPLKEYQTRNREMQAMTSIQSNLAAVAKELESAEKKAAKGGGRAAATAEGATQQWEAQAPYAFEQLQALDESRVNHLRDVLTQLETHEVDQVERNRTSAEACLNVLLNLSTEEEISAFVARSSAAATNGPPRTTPRERRSSSGPSASPAAAPFTATTPGRRHMDDTSGQSPYSTASSKMGPPPSSSSKKGFGGLRRLGTVLGRQEKSKGNDRAPSPEKRGKGGRNPLRRGPSSRQDMHQLESPPQTSSSHVAAQAPQLDNPLPLPRDGVSELEELPGQSFQPPARNNTGGPNGFQGSRQSFQPPARSNTGGPNGFQGSNRPAYDKSLPSQPTEFSSAPIPANEPSQNPYQQDTGAFASPSNAIDDITRAQQEAAAVGGDVDQSQFKLNIRDAPIQEEDQVAQQTAFSSVANTLRSQQAMPRKSNTVRGRRDVRNTIFVPSGPSSFEGAAGLTGFGAGAGQTNPLGVLNAPVNLSSSQISSQTDLNNSRAGSDAQSIRSAHSVSSTTHTAIVHPQLTKPGLNASIVETVSATFVDGQVSKSVVIGELALQYNDPSSSDAPPAAGAIETIRLDNFPILEKVAPNPTFITQKSAAAPGEYAVALSHTSACPTVAFKYQVHIDDASTASYAPLSIVPTWKIEPTQASVIINYQLNPAFTRHAAASPSLVLHNVIIMVSVEGTRASSCQSKPAGVFAKEKSLIYWKLGDVTLDSQGQQRLLARFSTAGAAQPGSVESRWELSDSNTTSAASANTAAAAAAGGGATEHLGSALSVSMEDAAAATTTDPFSDEPSDRAQTQGGGSWSWKGVSTTRKVVSGKYTASSNATSGGAASGGASAGGASAASGGVGAGAGATGIGSGGASASASGVGGRIAEDAIRPAT